MVLRNLDPHHGLCNGTRVHLIEMKSRLLKVRIITGPKAGETALIPRINFVPTDSQLPFKMRRRQFPVRVAFAMTMNKSQGQSLKKVGMDLCNPVFSHGQLYVALSRGTNKSGVKALLPEGSNGRTTNIVYKEALLKSVSLIIII